LRAFKQAKLRSGLLIHPLNNHLVSKAIFFFKTTWISLCAGWHHRNTSGIPDPLAARAQLLVP
jgi:hypothetical protein